MQLQAAQGGAVGGFNAQNQLRLILRILYANGLTEQVIVNARSFDESQKIKDDQSNQQLISLVLELLSETSFRLQVIQ
ncbi:hypothetical protein [Cytobacillus firmus]|uniref:hypothetical protein n=1 Tax=Cytobacillus firmus TaxID=1399 RepID=UPI0018CD191C|nr:hypothetical protein [Cytobacillus firmus]MBG9654903.1 hypothetical protein [Cytobacillus firmus]MED1907123.1 hypothetical protein [Cytobacillus firmus]